MRACPVSLSGGAFSPASCTHLLSISIAAASLWELLVHVLQTSLVGALTLQQEESGLLHTWSSSGRGREARLGLWRVILAWCKSMARADQVRPCEPLHLEQHRAALQTLGETCPTHRTLQEHHLHIPTHLHLKLSTGWSSKDKEQQLQRHK